MPTDSLTNALLRETTRLAHALEGLRRYYVRWLIALVLAVASLVTGTVFQLKPAVSYEFVIIFVSLALSLFLAQILNMKYRKRGKELFVQGMAQSAGLTYAPEGVFTLREVMHHKILPGYDTSAVEDGFEGTVHGVPVAFQEARLSDLQPVAGPRNSKREYTSFWGMLIRIRLRKRLESHTVVIPRSALQTFFRTALSTFEPVRVPPKFEKLYNVMSTDQIEARVILDPAFMERFMEAAAIMRAQWMEVSFRESEIFFAVQRNRPLFEVGHIWQPVTPPYLRKLADHIDAVDRMIEALKLNRQVGLR